MLTSISKKFILSAVLFLTVSVLAGCDEKTQSTASSTAVPEEIKIGVVPGPYKDILKKHLVPVADELGHKITFVEFSDWVQPDSALDAGEIDANLFQNLIYLRAIVNNQGLKLTDVISFPTLGLFAFSGRFASLDSIEKGSSVAIPNDAVNLARSLRFARDIGLITLKADRDELKASVADIDSNPKELEFIPMEAAQLPRSLDSVGVALVPGNYAYEARLDFTKSLAAEEVQEPIKLVVAVQTHRADSVGRFLKEAISSEKFTTAVNNDPLYSRYFAKPKWWPLSNHAEKQ